MQPFSAKDLMKLRSTWIFFTLCALLSIAPAAFAKTAKAAKETKEAKEVKSDKETGQGARRGVFVYSDLCVSPENGDIFGQRIIVYHFADGDMLTYEYAKGSLGWPHFAERVMVDAKTRSIGFVVQSENIPPKLVRGKFTRDGSGLTLDGDVEQTYAQARRIPLLQDFGKKWPKCDSAE
jgi:hypothetical protein